MNNIEKFFDEKSQNWDEKETKTKEFFDDFVAKYYPLKVGQKVLDLGCGTGVISSSIYKLTNAPVLGMDLSKEMIKIARKKYQENPYITFKAEDFYKTNEKDFDVIICHNAYPHFLDKIAFKNKCLEVLNKNGLLIISHSISKEEVNACHKRVSNGDKISNTLLSAKEESAIYLADFNLLKLEDDEYYLIILEKKN